MPVEKVRYAVVGLGHIAQAAVLPAFGHARINSELNALVSGSLVRLSKLYTMYKVGHTYDYDHTMSAWKAAQWTRVPGPSQPSP